MKWKIYAVLLILIVPVQTALVNHVSIHNIKPDLGLIAVCLIGIRMGEVEGLAMGSLIGLLMDLSAAGPVGANLLSKSLAGWLSGAIGRLFLEIRLVPALGILASLSVVSGFLVYLTLQIGRGDLEFFGSVRWIILPQALYDGVLGTLLLKMMPRAAVSRLE